ncbi:MAG: glycosyltransferase [Symploca sp. SIO2E9]|nr:glycosyltransferase [Symploca sp. SIO2E9]
MKILIVIPALGTVYGGPSKSVVELAQTLGNLGIRIDLVTTNANGSTSLDVPLHSWLSEKDYRIQYFPYWGWSDYKISFSLTRWLFQHVADYDLVHTNAIFSYSILPAYWACQQHRVPYVVTPRGMLEPWALSYKAGKKRFYYALLEKPALNRASAIQMLASTEAERTKPLNLKTPLVVVPNGINRQDFETLPNPEFFYHKFPDTRNKTLIIFLGRVDPKKGLDLLATAFGKVHTQFPRTHLIVAGPDNIGFLSTAQSYFAEAGCLDAVTFTGMLTGSLKYAALAAASIYIAPSYSEGFSMSVLEGMASGLACVITTGCNFPEAATAQAAHVVEINSEEIAAALTQILKHPQQAKEIGNRARQFILEQYTWDRIASNLIEVYTAILKKEPIPALSKQSFSAHA